NEINKKRREARRQNNERSESRRECLRLYNKTPRRKEANRELKRRQRDMQAITLNPESIAMEDPTFTPELVFPTIDAVEPDGSPLGARDWVILESTRRPFLPASTQTEEVGSPEMPIGPLRRKRHVPSGERQALLACQNQQFEAAIARNVSAPTEDNIDDAREADDLTKPHMTVEINNESMNLSQGPTVATNQSEGLSTQENGVERTQMMPKVNSNGDDDEGVIFKEDEDEDEGYLFVGQEEETDEEIEVDGSKDGFVAIPEAPDPYDAVYSNIPEETNMLKPVDNYVHCSEKKFEYEPLGFCCRNGKIKLSSQTTSDELVRLWSSADTDARHFHDNIRFFNGHFSFTSLYCWLDKMTTNMSDCGIYTFCAHGMLYHNIRPFGREAGTEHKHLELYFYDDDLSLEHRYQRYREEQLEKDKQVIKSMGHIENIDGYHIELNLDQTLDQKRYNTPLTSEVAAVWVEGSERRGQFSKSVMLHGKDRSSHGIRSYHGCYDALSYPLFFPRGELGWHANIPKANVTMGQVEAYRATHRKQDQNDDDPG
ncbi:hypothetical protein BS78_08G128100, partial [Paspalum vaginatum]